MRPYPHERPSVSSRFWLGFTLAAPISAFLWCGFLYLAAQVLA